MDSASGQKAAIVSGRLFCQDLFFWRQIAAPTISTVVGHMKRWVSIKLGYSIWQRSFFDRVIRNEKDYRAEYIDNNPAKMDTGYDVPIFNDQTE